MSLPLLLRGPATITPALFTSILLGRQSPALDQHAGSYYFDIIGGWKLNPAFLLGMFLKESECGSYAHAGANKAGVLLDKIAMRDARNWGNIRSNPDISQPPGGRAVRRVDSVAYGLFRGYDNWADGLNDVGEKLNSPAYMPLGFGAIIAKWAPASDGNDPVAYAQKLISWAYAWKVACKL